MSGRALWIVALGVALAGLIAFNVFRSNDRQSTAIERASGPSSAAEAEPPGASRVTLRPAENLGARSPADAAGGRDHATQPQPVAISPNPAPHASITQVLKDAGREGFVTEELLGADRAFAAESEDPTWSTAAEASVLGRIAGIPGLALVSLNVECRTTLCLLQFVTPQTPAPNAPDTVTIVRAAGLKSLYLMAVRDRSGAPVSLAYLQRVETADAPASVP